MIKIEDARITTVLIEEAEIPAVHALAQATLASTYDAYHPADEEPPEEDGGEEGDVRPAPQFFGDRGAAYKVVDGDEVIGGVFLSFDPFDPPRRTATITLFGIREDQQGRGIGGKVWRAIEEAHPEVDVWRLHTPAYALRNIAFYVNVCGFVLYEITKGAERYDWHMFRLRKCADRRVLPSTQP